MLGFATLSATPLSALPAAEAISNAESLGVITRFGSHTGIWNQFGNASGFSTVQVGSPTHRRTQPAEGFTSTQFGTPTGYKTQRASGFAPVQFGVPYLHPSHVAPWPISTQFGTPAAQQYWKVPSLGAVSKFGTPTTPTDRTGNASGFAPVQFGNPVAIRHWPPNTDILCLARGFKLALFGKPVAQWDQAAQAQAIAPTVQFCAPRAFTTHHAESLAPSVQLGAPSTRTTHRVSGFKPVAFGLAGAILTQHATGLAPKARFGTPKTIRSNWYEVRGFCPFRSGTPRGYQRNNRRADGFSPVQFGTPAAFHTHRCTSIPPIARLGRPLLKRITQC